MWREPTSFQSDRAPISIAFVWHAGGLVLSSVFTQIRGLLLNCLKFVYVTA